MKASVCFLRKAWFIIILMRELHRPEGSDDEVYDLVTGLLFGGLQRLTKETDGLMLEKGQYTFLLHGINAVYFGYKLDDKSDCGSEMKDLFNLLAAGGGMYVEVFNRVTLLAYNIIKKNKVEETNTYLDGSTFVLLT
ncbi:unnamed protein product [Eruca vesicaria subsp. sativa]|uniref:Uncharacterized protein n=1 Tax=Eruca vesicaria subsp. sativa TaxID=29727 RepID=A0ABC8IQC4_ERUVS|nr:unnamed protein product [Eruca vesicaria subsp. sativa]